MATKIPIAQKRLFQNVFIDRKTNRKIRADPIRVLAGKVRGRGPKGSKKLRPVRKK